MSRFDALDPTPEEIAALTAPLRPEDTRRAAEWSAPTPEEIARLVATRHPPRRPVSWLAPALAAAALLLLQLQPVPPAARLSPPIPPAVVYAVPSLPLGVPYTLKEPLTLGPSIQIEGAGEVRLLRADAGGTALAVLSGAATFEVDPGGMYRDLAVHAGAVTVLVTGTRFTVATDPISVSVERGSVRILHPGGELALSAGGSWTQPAALQEPTPPVPSPAAPPTPEQPPLSVALAWSEILNARDDGVDATELLRRADDFIADNPGHPLTGEASAWRLTLLRELRPEEELVGEVDAWLAAWPDSHRRGEVLLLRATLSRRAGDCLMASAYYRAVLEEPAPPLHAEAQQWLDWCASR
jgi:hypothetical protein